MKKETKRYMIIEYAGSKQRVYDTKEELDKVLDDIRKYNNRKTSKYICGNIAVDKIDGKYHVNIHLYHKLTGKNTISDVDKFTKSFTKRELIAYFAPQLKTEDGYEPDINIAYMESKDATDEQAKPLVYGVKYIPIMYRDDVKYLDDTFIRKCLKYHAKEVDVDFFKGMASEFCFHHVLSEVIEKLYIQCDRVEHQGYDPMGLYYISLELYNKLIYERERDGSMYRDENGKYQISARRKRDFAFYLKNYDAAKRNSPLRYNGSLSKMRKQNLLREREDILLRRDAAKLTFKLK